MSARRIPWIAFALALLAGIAGAQAAEFRDLFAERETVDTAAGLLTGNNTGATIEPEEPDHGGKHPSHSLWISWIAPENGLATLQVSGAGFDTLLGVYQLEPGTDPPLKRLRAIAENDDDRGQPSSRIQFGVRAGERYEIAVDGFAGATGALALEWSLETLPQLIPSITLLSSDHAAQIGDTVTLAVAVGAGDTPKLHWVFNDQELENEEGSTLVIRNFQPANVGQYQVRVEVGKARFFSPPVELQISSEGVVAALARNKPQDALDSALVGDDGSSGRPNARVRLASTSIRPAGGPTGLTRGYNGTQIFNTVFAGRDVLEPAHCGFPASASYWFAYEPPAAGTLQLNTDGSAFDTVLEVYTYDPPLLGYASLRSLACDNNSGANALTSRLELPCETGRTYLVVVDGVNGAHGLTYLNYRLDTNVATVTPPVLGPAIPPVTARLGDRAELSVTSSGTPPLHFLWRKDSAEIPGETNASLVLDPVQFRHAGSYSVEVSNAVGAATNSPISVAVWSPPILVLDAAGATARLQFGVAGPLNFTIEATGNLGETNWIPARSPAAEGLQVSLPVPLDAAANRFFRVRFE